MIKVENPANRKDKFLRFMQTDCLMKSASKRSGSTTLNAGYEAVDIVEDEQFAFCMALNLRADSIPRNTRQAASEFAGSVRGKKVGEPRESNPK